MKIIFLLFGYLTFLLFPQNLVFGFDKAIFEKKMKRTIEAFEKKHKPAGLAVGVIKSSFELEKPYEKLQCFGDAQRFPQITIKNSTVFRLGRCSHMFLGFLLARALDENKLEFGSEIRSVLPKSFSIPKFHDTTIKLSDIAFHMSSLPFEAHKLLRRHEISQVEIKNYLKSYKLPKKPGSFYLKSDLGYSLLSVALETVYRTCLENLYKETFFKPLDLKLTTLKTYKEHEKKLACSYLGVKLAQKDFVDRDYSFYNPSVGMLTTPEDMQKIMKFFLRVEENDYSKHLYTFLKKKVLMPDQIIEKAGLGFKISPLSIEKTLPTYKVSSQYHGFSSYIAFVPDTKTSVFILSNSEENLEKLGEKILTDLND